MDKPTIVLVDDEPIYVSLVLALLDDDYQLVAANSGVGAIEVLSSMEPDLIIVDITMPHVNGYQVIKYIKENEKIENVPVLVISSLTHECDQQLALTIGADEYLCKPILPNKLLATIEKYVC
ncbi:response regulator [Shewanella sp. MMG014]|uniref:response regulator n=1 Tax=Shewanella sp. MMG014 TaxID=2822691 RepID=UPI001B395225|nr:response regulator [Shewanella sp. MMG014]MBQ4892174.1 response regulator [Shewanella sp. MMG014]